MVGVFTQLNKLLARALAGTELSVDDATELMAQQDPEAIADIRAAADEMRRTLVGDTVTYVVNRNINFTNICEQHCSFCAFRRNEGTEGAYWLDNATIAAKAAEAIARGATEICMQGGLNPAAQIDGSTLKYYVQLVAQLKAQWPELHLHAFSPQEIQFIARQDGLGFARVIGELQAAGVGSMPGTAAEIFAPAVRRKLCPEKLTADEWVEVVSTAHQLGMPTTSTMLGGHIESHRDRADHFAVLRSLQKQAKASGQTGFTEFILLPYVGESAPAMLRRKVGRDQPVLDDSVLTMAVARLFAGEWIVNHQPSWVKLGLGGAAIALQSGCNDIGGTLMEEHITSMAGAKGGTGQSVEALRGTIAGINRPNCERTTLYDLVMRDTTNGQTLADAR